MNPNPTMSHLVFQSEHDLLSRRAERGWMTAQAATARPHRPVMFTVRRAVGAFLVFTGEQLQGTTHRTGTARSTEATLPS